MSQAFDYCIHEIIEKNRSLLGDQFNDSCLHSLDKPGFKNQVKDSANVYRIEQSLGGSPLILTVSNPEFPDAVGDAVGRAQTVRSLLTAEIADPILSPMLCAECEGRSYAFWPLQIPISENRLLRKAQLLSINSRVIKWIAKLGKTTGVTKHSSEAIQDQFIDPLKYVLDDTDMPAAVKQAAQCTLVALQASKFNPVSVVQHGDFWQGNILLARHWPFLASITDSFLRH